MDIQLHQSDPQSFGNGKNPFVPIELTIADSVDSRIGHQFKAVPARARRRVQWCPFTATPVLGGLDDGIGFGMDSRSAVTVLHLMTDIMAMR